MQYAGKVWMGKFSHDLIDLKGFLYIIISMYVPVCNLQIFLHVPCTYLYSTTVTIQSPVFNAYTGICTSCHNSACVYEWPELWTLCNVCGSTQLTAVSLCRIFSFLDVISLCRCAQVSRVSVFSWTHTPTCAYIKVVTHTVHHSIVTTMHGGCNCFAVTRTLLYGGILQLVITVQAVVKSLETLFMDQLVQTIATPQETVQVMCMCRSMINNEKE